MADQQQLDQLLTIDKTIEQASQQWAARLRRQRHMGDLKREKRLIIPTREERKDVHHI